MPLTLSTSRTSCCVVAEKRLGVMPVSPNNCCWLIFRTYYAKGSQIADPHSCRSVLEGRAFAYHRNNGIQSLVRYLEKSCHNSIGVSCACPQQPVHETTNAIEYYPVTTVVDIVLHRSLCCAYSYVALFEFYCNGMYLLRVFTCTCSVATECTSLRPLDVAWISAPDCGDGCSSGSWNPGNVWGTKAKHVPHHSITFPWAGIPISIPCPTPSWNYGSAETFGYEN